MPMPRPLPVPPGPDALGALPDLERALDGGAPVHPHAPDEPPALPREPGTPDEPDTPDDLAVVVATSGSTGEPKPAMLTATALLASAAATAQRLGGPGQWLLALPPHHVAGLQVLLRSVLAGITPVVTASRSPFDLVQATAAMTGDRRYTSLVPTQLARLVSDPVGLEALRRFDAVLVGGAAVAPDLLDRARAEGVRVVTTYGMSETCGGCVYNGTPLADVRVRTDDTGRLHLGGPVVAAGYLGLPDLTAAAFTTDEGGTRWFATSDLGEVTRTATAPGSAPGSNADATARTRVRVLGRADDVITTGGLKVTPRAVEEAVLAHVAAVTAALVVGVPDPEWGQAVALVAVTSPGGPPTGPVPDDGVAQIREMLRPHLPAHALPRRVLVVEALPARGPGKPDRPAARALLTAATTPTTPTGPA